MKKFLSVSIVSLVLLSACADHSKSIGSDLGTSEGVMFEIESLKIEGCGPSCSAVIVDLKLVNDTPHAVCAPSVYGSDGLSAALWFIGDNEEDLTFASVSAGDNEISAFDYRSAMQILTKRPSYVVQRGETLSLRVVLRDIYDFSKFPAKVVLRSSSFLCDQSQGRGLYVRDHTYFLSDF